MMLLQQKRHHLVVKKYLVKENKMPNVAGMKFPYSTKGKAKAKKEMLKIKKSKTVYGKK